jgi:hypothetical protein
MSGFLDHGRRASESPMASRGRGRKQAKKGVQLTLMVVGTFPSTRHPAKTTIEYVNTAELMRLMEIYL